MIIGRDRSARRALIIRRHRAMLEAEVRAMQLGILPDEDVQRVFSDVELDQNRSKL